MNHTPGPWVTSDEGNNTLILADGKYIASVWHYDNGPEGGNLMPNIDADATLISAAPDLLAALRDLVSQVQGYQECNGDKGFAFTDAQAAIAKATGVSA